MDPYPAKEYYPDPVWDVLKMVVPGLCKYWEIKLKDANNSIAQNRLARSSSIASRSSQSGDPTKVGIRALDLFVWAVIGGETDLSKELLDVCQARSLILT